MKKVLATLLAVMLVIATSITAFGATISDVEQKEKSAISYAYDNNYGVNGYDVIGSKYVNYSLRAGAKADSFKAGYMASVNSAITDSSITPTQLALAVQNYVLMGENVTNDMKNAFEATAPTSYFGYDFTYAAQAAKLLDNAQLVDDICDDLVTYYTMGVGTDFWGGYGTSADDLSMFILALVNDQNKYQSYIDDALTLLETYYTPNGYDNYGANADSTALALAVYSALGDKDKADAIYNILIDEFYDQTTGGFKAAYDPYYATEDAVYGMSFYHALLKSLEVAEQPAVKPQKTDDKKISPNTGAEFGIISLMLVAFGGAMVVVLRKKVTE